MGLKYLIIILLIITFGCNPTLVFSQNNSNINKKYDKEIVNDSSFTYDIAKLLVAKFNDYRSKHGLDSLFINPLLRKAADYHARYMCFVDEVGLEEKAGYKATADRMLLFGGSKYADEIVIRVPVQKHNVIYTYNQIAEEIAFKLLSNKRYIPYFENLNYNYVGIGGSIDEDMKKLFVSVVFGNYKSFNAGANKRDKMTVPFSTKQYNIKPYDAKACRNSERYKNIYELQKGLFVKNNEIFFQNDNVRKLKRIIKNPNDGFAVDIVQKSQYFCDDVNIYDNNLVSKGILLKPVYSNKLLNKSILPKTRANRNKLLISLGKLPSNIGNDYELNLIVVQNQCACFNIFKTYLEDIKFDYNQKVEFVADTISFENQNYTPKYEKSIISFKIPFNKNITKYDQKEIEPLLKSLNEPDFVINSVTITAYSSIEGKQDVNKNLQDKRAESIANAIKKIQKNNIVSKINTAENWEDFKSDVENTEFEFLAKKSLEEAQEYILKEYSNIKNKLEPILKNHRYALVDMEVTYNINNIKKEQQYVVCRFNSAVEKKDLTNALLIQKYIFKKVLAGIYDSTTVKNQIIPQNKKTAGLLMNKLWLQMYINKNDNDIDYYSDINKLHILNKKNHYIAFNNVYCMIQDRIIEDSIQTQIDSLYNSPFTKETVDLLNLEYQFMILRAVDTLPRSEQLEKKTLAKIKSIVNIEASDYESAYKLCKLFIEFNDYKYALKLIEPFVYTPGVFEDLIFTYISLCTLVPNRVYSSIFFHATKIAYKMNPKKYCKLINDGKMSFQVFDNPDVKQFYCKYCK